MFLSFSSWPTPLSFLQWENKLLPVLYIKIENVNLYSCNSLNPYLFLNRDRRGEKYKTSLLWLGWMISAALSEICCSRYFKLDAMSSVLSDMEICTRTEKMLWFQISKKKLTEYFYRYQILCFQKYETFWNIFCTPLLAVQQIS